LSPFPAHSSSSCC